MFLMISIYYKFNRKTTRHFIYYLQPSPPPQPPRTNAHEDKCSTPPPQSTPAPHTNTTHPIPLHQQDQHVGRDQGQTYRRILAKADTSFQHLERRLISRGGQFLAGKQLTWADLMLFNMVDLLSPLACIKMENYPQLNNLRLRVVELPNIKAYLSSRPAEVF